MNGANVARLEIEIFDRRVAQRPEDVLMELPQRVLGQVQIGQSR